MSSGPPSPLFQVHELLERLILNLLSIYFFVFATQALILPSELNISLLSSKVTDV